jgi:hypothetical protein
MFNWFCGAILKSARNRPSDDFGVRCLAACLSYSNCPEYERVPVFCSNAAIAMIGWHAVPIVGGGADYRRSIRPDKIRAAEAYRSSVAMLLGLGGPIS